MAILKRGTFYATLEVVNINNKKMPLETDKVFLVFFNSKSRGLL